MYKLLDNLISHLYYSYVPTSWDISAGGEHRNESIFASSSTIKHASHTDEHLLEHYTSDEIDERVELFYADDYNNEYLDLSRYST